MLTDWLSEIQKLKWAVGSLEKLFQNGSSEREIYINASRGIESRLDWISDQAKKEIKREPK